MFTGIVQATCNAGQDHERNLSNQDKSSSKI